MVTVSVSSDYQVLIPPSVREALRIKPGQKIQVVPYRNRIELIPILPIKSARGFLPGIDTTVEREPDHI